MSESTKNIRNIAIIAHVDHGKTTLVDAMLKQTGIFRDNQKVDERVMDSNDLEREKGITIFSKNAAVIYKGCKINIVDTPGHSDFGGEVQRILRMVDSVLLLVDAFEGPMPQTKYVLKKSLELGLKPIVVINKIDRPMARPHAVLDMVFDLFIDLNATDKQLDFPVIYASAKNGSAMYEIEHPNGDLMPLFEMILKHVVEPDGDPAAPLQFLASAIDYDNYLGRVGTGRIHNGVVKQGDDVLLFRRDGTSIRFKITKLFAYEGLARKEIKEAGAGDIVTIAGAEGIDVGETVCDIENPSQLPFIDIDEPTISMSFMANNSPFMGREGKFVTSTNLRDRLERERQANVSLVIDTTSADAYTVKGRGELQLSILIENMRREGYEFQVSKPVVIYKTENGKKMEPLDLAVIDVADEFAGTVIEKMGIRKGEMVNMIQGQDKYTRLEFKVPARGLIGFRNEFLTETRGTGILNQTFFEYGEYRGEIPGRSRGVLVQMETGRALAYGLDNLQERGVLFIGPGAEVYEGMIVGENSREEDMPVNVCKAKKLTNIRASGTDDAIRLTPPREFSLEQALEYIDDDELLEVTPKNLRMRKKILDAHERKKASKV